MRFRTRLVLLVTGLLASAIVIISALLAWNTRNALLASAEDSGKMVANLLARKAGFAPEEINRRLRSIADTTAIDEFWITDEKGHAYLRNVDVDFTFSPSPM